MNLIETLREIFALYKAGDVMPREQATWVAAMLDAARYAEWQDLHDEESVR